MRSAATILAALLALLGGARAQDGDAIAVVFHAPPSCTARILVSVHATARQFAGEDPPAAQAVLPAGTAPCPERLLRLRGIAPGAYALRAFQDLNGNGQLDRPMIGPPSEPWAVSNNVRHSFRAPRFEEARIALVPGGPPVVLNLR